jgi:hypothetical protein
MALEPIRLLDRGYVEDGGIYGMQTLLDWTRHDLVIVSTAGTYESMGGYSDTSTIVASCVTAGIDADPDDERLLTVAIPNATVQVLVKDIFLEVRSSHKFCRSLHEALVLLVMKRDWDGVLDRYCMGLISGSSPTKTPWTSAPPKSRRVEYTPVLSLRRSPPEELEYDPW